MEFNKKTWMGLFIAFIMIVSVIGFALSFATPTEKVKYGGYTFTRTSQGWHAIIDDVRATFIYPPTQLEYIDLPSAATPALGSRVIWVTYDPYGADPQQIADVFYYIDDVLTTIKDTYVQRGLVNNTDYQLPEITCANATAAVPVILIVRGNETMINYNDNCLTATAETARDVYQVGDRILYQALGVMS